MEIHWSKCVRTLFLIYPVAKIPFLINHVAEICFLINHVANMPFLIIPVAKIPFHINHVANMPSLKNHIADTPRHFWGLLRVLTSLDTRPNLAPPTHFLVGKFGLALLH